MKRNKLSAIQKTIVCVTGLVGYGLLFGGIYSYESSRDLRLLGGCLVYLVLLSSCLVWKRGKIK